MNYFEVVLQVQSPSLKEFVFERNIDDSTLIGCVKKNIVVIIKILIHS